MEAGRERAGRWRAMVTISMVESVLDTRRSIVGACWEGKVPYIDARFVQHMFLSGCCHRQRVGSERNTPS